MHCKNILWVDGTPFIIDLECLDYGNPFWDMFQLALSWSGNVHCSIDFELSKGFIVSYHEEYGYVQVDWETLYGSGFGWLEWLEYNIKGNSMIECTERKKEKWVSAKSTKPFIVSFIIILYKKKYYKI